MKELPKHAALVLIDVQKGFDYPVWGQRNNPEAEENMAKLLQVWRGKKEPVIHVQHLSTEADSPLRPNQPGCEFKEIVRPLAEEPVFQKRVNSAFIGTNLESYLRERNIDTLIITGLTTDHCVSTTTRMAGNLGFNTYVVADATATFERKGHDGRHYTAEEIHHVSIASLHQEFATVVITDQIIQKEV